MLTKDDESKSKDGINLSAVFQLLIAATIFILWGRSLLNTFKTKEKPESLNYSATLQAEQVAFLLNNQREEKQEIIINVPTQQINVIVENVYPTPVNTPEPKESGTVTTGPASTLGKNYDFVIVPYEAGREVTFEEGEKIQVRLSWYYPPLGNVLTDNPFHINCDRVPGTDLPECDYTASGFTWFEDVGYWLACPENFPFGTKFIIEGKEFKCMDRGGAILIENDVAWVDILYPSNPFPNRNWGDVVTAVIKLPIKVGE